MCLRLVICQRTSMGLADAAVVFYAQNTSLSCRKLVRWHAVPIRATEPEKPARLAPICEPAATRGLAHLQQTI